MSHIQALGAAIFTDLSVGTGTITAGIALGTEVGTPNETNFKARFANENRVKSNSVGGSWVGTNSFTRIGNVREFPTVGTPANIVNVPVYGQKQSSSIQGQADAPSLELTINYIPSLWEKGNSVLNVLGNMVGDGVSRPWRFTLLQVEPTGVGSVQGVSDAAATIAAYPGATSAADNDITGNILTISSYSSGNFVEGSTITGTGIAAGTIIEEQLTGTRYQNGTYRINNAQTVPTVQVSATAGLFTINSLVSGQFGPGQILSGSGVTAGTKIYAQLTGTLGGAGGATFSVSPSQSVSATTITGSGDDGTRYGSLQTAAGGGIFTVENSQYFWNGKLEALLVKSELRDTATATLTLSIQTDFYGAFTNT